MRDPSEMNDRETQRVTPIFTTMMKYMRFLFEYPKLLPDHLLDKENNAQNKSPTFTFIAHSQLSLVRSLCEVNMVQSIVLFKITRLSGFYFFWSHFTKRKKKERTEFTYICSSKT